MAETASVSTPQQPVSRVVVSFLGISESKDSIIWSGEIADTTVLKEFARYKFWKETPRFKCGYDAFAQIYYSDNHVDTLDVQTSPDCATMVQHSSSNDNSMSKFIPEELLVFLKEMKQKRRTSHE